MKTTRTHLLLLFCLFGLAAAAGIFPCTRVNAAKKIRLSAGQITMVKGQKKTLKLTGAKKPVKWICKNKRIAAMKKTGKASVGITAKKKGSTYLYAKCGGRKYRCKIIVETPSLNRKTVALQTGKTFSLNISGTRQKITYKSSNPSVAEINKQGMITAKTPGTASITARLACGKKYTCRISVSAADSVTTPPSSDTVNADAGEYSIGVIHTGDGTYYDGGYVGGCCNLDDIAGNYYVAAVHKEDYRAGSLAGAYLKVTGPHGSINVLVTDTLADGEGKKGDIDLNKEAFSKIEPLVTGRMTVTWEIIPLPTEEPIQYVYKPTSNQYWMQVQIRNHRYPVKKLEIQTSSNQYKELPREEYNYFTLDNPGAGPYNFRVTDIYGHVLIDRNVPLSPSSPVKGTANFPY
ncbi:MAG: Ig-like domain-containing protein [Bacteroidales bacterium]|nr:Ig-like domain-containing protein [Clostridium sp.]MCM1204432.1 Ig-like domain-containing protein [Bacteroidales bacterium]